MIKVSFSTDVKNELLALEILSPCCRHAEAYGMLISGRAFSVSAVSLSTSNSSIADFYTRLIKEECGVDADIPEPSGRKISVTVKKAADRRKVLDAFGHSAGEPTLRINRSNFADECCFSAFLRGAFLACGTITSPEKNYHLEFVVPFLKLSGDLFCLMDELGLKPKKVLRKGSHVIYFKDSERIEDVLTTMGATNSSLELMGIKINKDIRNRVNRRVNFETANIGRAVIAGLAQVEAIETIQRFFGLDSLPEALRKTAEIRLENPEATLSELEELHDMEVSRSGINHRLGRLISIAEELKDKHHTNK